MKKERTNGSPPASTVFDFSALAGVYDQWYETLEGHRFDLLEKRALKRLIGRLEPGASLLELGSGTGWWSRFFIELSYRVTGVDRSAKMVEVACSKRIPNAEFERADGQNLPFSDHRFAAAAAVTSIEFTRDPELVIREMIRSIKPGGRLYLGLLNGSAPLNKERKSKKEGVFAAARFFDSRDVKALLAPYGRPTIMPCAFPLSIKMPTSIAGWADDLQQRLNMTSGAFIAVRMDLLKYRGHSK